VDATDRGTSKRKEGFPCQRIEGLNITVGISVGASVSEAGAAQYLGRFGVVPITGDRTNPGIICNSVYYSRRLADVMDDVGRKKIQTLVCAEITFRTFDRASAEANKIIETVASKATEYFAYVQLRQGRPGCGEPALHRRAEQGNSDGSGALRGYLPEAGGGACAAVVRRS
jgi:hypothetical protein